MANIIGNNFPNLLRGTSGRDVIKGLGSLDALYGLGGNDKLYGGPGNDLVVGGKGRDQLWGNSGNDLFKFNNRDGFWNPGTGKWDDVVYDYQDNRDAFDIPGPGGAGSFIADPVTSGPQGAGTHVTYAPYATGEIGGFFVKGFTGNFSNDDFI
jgi:Ca2+-binding RTX toxin-like protein